MTQRERQGRKRQILERMALRWALVDSEYLAVCEYLKGPQTCNRYDALPSIIRQVVDDVNKQYTAEGLR